MITTTITFSKQQYKYAKEEGNKFNCHATIKGHNAGRDFLRLTIQHLSPCRNNDLSLISAV